MQKFRPFAKTTTLSQDRSQTMNGASPPSPADDPLDSLARAREELKSAADEEPDTGVTHVPDGLGERGKVGLAALFSLPPWGRTVVVLAVVALIGALAWRLGPALGELLKSWAKLASALTSCTTPFGSSSSSQS